MYRNMHNMDHAEHSDHHTFEANGQMDDIFYQDSIHAGNHHRCDHSSAHAGWEQTHYWNHNPHIHGSEAFHGSSKDQHGHHSIGLDGENSGYTCENDCHDLSCGEPPCTECDEDVIVCTDAACSPPADHGPCDAFMIGNTSCAGELPCDVLLGAKDLTQLLQGSDDRSYSHEPQFSYLSIDGNPCSFPVQHFGQCQYAGVSLHSGMDAGFIPAAGFPSQSFGNPQEFGLHCSTHPAQCYGNASQCYMPASLQHRISPTDSSLRSSYSPNPYHTTVIPHRSSIEGLSTSPFSPTPQHIYEPYSDVTTPSTGTQTPLQESLNLNPLSYEFAPGPSDIGAQVEHSEITRCRWMSNGQECEARFNNAGDLQSHIQECHTSALKKADGFVCQWHGCIRLQTQPDKAGFAQRSKLDRHVQSHTGYKACICEWKGDDGSICGKHFSTQQSLTLHERTHTGEKPHKCDHPGCDYAAAQASQLTMHIRTRHTKVKPLVCPFEGCGASFSESSNLSKHKKIHQPGEHCICKLCDRVFRRPDQLKRHMNTTHKSAAVKAQHRRGTSLSGNGSVDITPAEWQSQTLKTEFEISL